MNCENCGGALDLVEQSGGTTEGKFREEYECVNCGATGWIKGEASDHLNKWAETGRAFRRDVAAEKENIR